MDISIQSNDYFVDEFGGEEIYSRLGDDNRKTSDWKILRDMAYGAGYADFHIDPGQFWLRVPWTFLNRHQEKSVMKYVKKHKLEIKQERK